MKTRSEWLDYLRQKLSITTDSIGCTIDDGVLELCIYLNYFGIITTMSCEGHDDCGKNYPWIHLYRDDESALTMLRILKELQIEDVEIEVLEGDQTPSLRPKTISRNLKDNQQVMNTLLTKLQTYCPAWELDVPKRIWKYDH